MRRQDGKPARIGIGVVLLMALAVLPSCRLAAQTFDSVPKPRVPSLVRYGKWISLGGAGALAYVANSHNREAEASYVALQDRCFFVPNSCILGPGGHYTDPVSEGLYNETRRQDRMASRALIGAEVAVAAAAVGFVWELLRREDRPPTIPFEPRIERTLNATHVGLNFRF